MVVIGSERGNTGIIADGEVTQGTKVGVGIARIVRVGSIGRDMHTAALVPEDRDGAEDNGTWEEPKKKKRERWWNKPPRSWDCWN